MATLTINTKKIIENIQKLNLYLSENNIQWTLVTKMLCGYKEVLEKIITDKSIKDVHSIGDSRISNLKTIKEISPKIVTMYLKPPTLNQVKNVIKYSDISLNSSFKTIEELNTEAEKQGKKHRIIVMIEMGELREGILREDILVFYERIFKLKNIETIGLGTNLGCMYGVEPTYDKLIQLSLYTRLIEARFNKKLELISGGSSITLPLISKGKVPKGINHFRIGEAALLGLSPLNNKKFKNLSTSAIEFTGDILELNKKEIEPDGIIGEGNVGHTSDLVFDKDIKKTYRCIVDFGQLDVDVNNLLLKDKKLQLVGTTSDMTVYDLGKEKGKYNVGSQVHYMVNYTSTTRLMNSRYITKKII